MFSRHAAKLIPRALLSAPKQASPTLKYRCCLARGMVLDVRTSQHQQRASFVTITQTQSTDPLPSEPPLSDRNSASLSTHNNNTEATALNITESCWSRIHTLTRDSNEAAYLRLFVDSGGCSGFTYQFEMDTTDLADDDVTFQDDHGARFVIDTGSLAFLQGATIDYVQEMIKSAFAVTDNPQSESACGCGSSFALKNFASNPTKD